MNTSTATAARGSAPATRPVGPGAVARIMRLFSVADAQTALDQGKGELTGGSPQQVSK